MEFKTTQTEDTMTVAVIGRLDTKTTPELESGLGEIPPEITTVIFDFSELDYISSSGLRLLLIIYKVMSKRGGGVKILNANDSILEVFEATGFDGIFEVA